MTEEVEVKKRGRKKGAPTGASSFKPIDCVAKATYFDGEKRIREGQKMKVSPAFLEANSHWLKESKVEDEVVLVTEEEKVPLSALQGDVPVSVI